MQPVTLPPPPPPTSASASTPRLTLQPTLSPSTSFLFPSLYSFPPFFTRQPNPQTWLSQLATWHTLVLAHARHTRTFSLDLSDAQCALEPFANPRLGRRLALETLRTIVEELVREGQAAWVDPQTKKAVWVYWKRPDEWASSIYAWVSETGQTNSVMTFYELVEGGDMAHTSGPSLLLPPSFPPLHPP